MPAVMPCRTPSCLHGHSARSGVSCRDVAAISRRGIARSAPEGLSGVNEPPMIILMTTTGRAQQRYDYRFRDLVRATGDVTIATDVGVPRSTARGWLREVPAGVGSPGGTTPTTSAR